MTVAAVQTGSQLPAEPRSRYVRLRRLSAAPKLLVAFATGGCVSSLRSDDLCDELSQAVALRVMQCTGEAPLAEAHHQAVSAQTCRAEHDDTGLSNLEACATAILEVPCYEITALPLEPDWAWWMSKDPGCAAVYEAPKGGSTGPGSCSDPHVIDLARNPTSFPIVRDYGPLPDLPECFPGGLRDVVFEVLTPVAGDVALNVSSSQPGVFIDEVRVAVLPEDAPCAATATFACATNVHLNSITLFQASAGSHRRFIVVQQQEAKPWSAQDVGAHFYVQQATP